MIIDAAMRQNRNTVAEAVWVWFLRIMAVICFVSGLIYWMQLLGIAPDKGLRFDLIDPLWRMVSTVLAVILPVAALGLWLTANWGVVVWLVAIAIESAVYGWWGLTFVEKPLLVFGHAVSFGFLLLIAAIVYMQRRKLRLSVH